MRPVELIRFHLRYLGATIAIFFAAQPGFSSPAADLILINGKIITVDAKDSIALDLKNLKCELTLLKGRKVYPATDSPLTFNRP